ncbi:hypothetical protein V6N12_050407 [Hibiscus sabdariffa]|uniref:Uncharacterized protein n=1 Tax=Hibiscus sabdariffa TaxID=183260 RepID=A0ABR2GCC7_9ROSI
MLVGAFNFPRLRLFIWNVLARTIASFSEHANWRDFLTLAWDPSPDLISALAVVKLKMVEWNRWKYWSEKRDN